MAGSMASARVLWVTVFLLGLITLPLIHWQNAPVPYEVPKTWFLYGWVLILLALSPLAIITSGANKLQLPLIGMLTVFVIWSTFTAITGADLQKSFTGNYYRGDGLITLLSLYCLTLVTGAVLEKKYIRLVGLAIAGTGITLSILYILHKIFHLPLNDALWFGNVNFLTGYLIVSLPFTYSLKLKRGLAVGLVFAHWIAILLTGAIIGAVLLPISAIVYLFSKMRTRNALFGLATLVIVAVITGKVLLAYTHDPNIAESRTRIYTKLLTASRERPLLGWGWANADHAFNAVDWPFPYEQDAYVDKAHGQILEILVSTGLPGFLLFTSSAVVAGHALWRQKRQKYTPWLTAFLIYIFHSQTNVISVSEEALYWVILGIAAQGKSS